MLTVDDIKKLTKVFATKQDIARIEENMATKVDFRKYMTMIENTFTEVKKIREEQSAHFNEHRRINDRLDSIERVTVIAQAIAK